MACPSSASTTADRPIFWRTGRPDAVVPLNDLAAFTEHRRAARFAAVRRAWRQTNRRLVEDYFIDQVRRPLRSRCSSRLCDNSPQDTAEIADVRHRRNRRNVRSRGRGYRSDAACLGASWARRRRRLQRWPRGTRASPPVDHRPGGRPPAAEQCRGNDLAGVQRRDLQLRGAAPATRGARPSIRHAQRLRSDHRTCTRRTAIVCWSICAGCLPSRCGTRASSACWRHAIIWVRKPFFYTAQAASASPSRRRSKALLALDPGLRQLEPAALDQYLALRIIAPPLIDVQRRAQAAARASAGARAGRRTGRSCALIGICKFSPSCADDRGAADR